MTEPTAVLSAEVSAHPEKLIAGFQRADQATGAWAAAAARHMQTAQASFNGVDFTVVTSKAKAEQLKLIELQHQLDVARAAGEAKTVRALSEEIALLTKVRQLRSAGLTGPDAMIAAKASLAGVAAAREAAEARELAARRGERLTGNPGQALQNVFARTRLGALEEGGAKIPIFGSALEELGVAGVAAAGGLAATALAAEQVRKSMEYAEAVQKASAALGVSTTSLQKYDDAAVATGIGQDKFRESLQRFNVEFGKYSSGLAAGRSAKFFNALGFTPESARQIGDVGQALDKTLVGLAKLQNPQQRAALAEKFGLTAFLPLLAEGEEGIKRFQAAQDSFAASGALISPEQLSRAAELNDKVEELRHRIGQEFKAAFVDAAPAIEAVAVFLERCAHAAASLIGELPDVARGIADLARHVPAPVVQGAAAFGRQVISDAIPPQIGQIVTSSKQVLDALAERGKVAKLRGGIGDLIAGKVTDPAARAAFENTGTPGVNLAPPPKPKKTREAHDSTEAFATEGVNDVNTEQKNLDQARAALTDNIQARAAFELKVIADEAAKRQDDLDAQIDKINATKGLAAATKAALIAQRTQASDLAAEAASTKAAKITRDALQAQARQELEDAQRSSELQDRILSAQASIATSASARAELELQIFRDRQSSARDAERLRISTKQATDSSYAPDQAAADQSSFDTAQRADLVAERTRQQRQINPLYDRANPSTSAASDLQGIEAKGLDGVTDTLASLATNSSNAKAAFHDLITSMITDLVRLGLQRSFEAPLANLLFGASPVNNLGNLGQTSGSASAGNPVFGLLGTLFGAGRNSSGVPGASDVPASAFAAIDAMTIPGFATGTDSTPGGLTRYNERGVEGYVPPGAQIIPNETLRGLAQLTPDRLGGGATTMNHHISIDLTGANGDETIRQIAYSAAAHGTAQAIATSRSDMRRSQASARQNLTRF